MDADYNVQDFVLGLPALHGQHSGNNIAAIVENTLENFSVTPETIGYFVLDNAYNNDTAVDYIAGVYGFNKAERRLRCTCYIVNLAAQEVIYSKDKEAFENADKNIPVSIIAAYERVTNAYK